MTEKVDQDVMEVNASYKTLATINGVIVKVPGAGDIHLRWIKAHQIKTKNGLHSVESHYRRGDIFSGRFVTRRFFLGPEFVGQTIVTAVFVVEKTDHNKNDEKSLILEIYPSIGSTPTSRLKIGSPTGEFAIPGVKAYIKFDSKGF
jgi:hypothetical protein